jgi:TetR/AcrR family transcriptional regulator, transcriptional repressor of aconitase
VPKVTQDHLDARRAQILDGARRAFAEHGYEGATVARLEEATGLSRGAIFHYFGSKQDLFVALAWEMNTRLGDILLEHGMAGAVRALTLESPEWLGVLIEAQAKLRHDPEFVRKMDAREAASNDRVRDWFAEQQTAGRLRSDLPSIELGRFATSVINGLALRIVANDPFDVEAAVQLLDDAIAPR